jgi:lipopolysaccharide/colanic/teichoic acid biosynthesis glycosyltransferase
MYQSFFKRVLDLVTSLVALIVLAPIMLATAALVRATLGSPVLFRQRRPGRNGAPFDILKFRTMRLGRAGDDDALRLTTVGRLLRSLSLDELPELFNVISGSMSLVGPRPLLMQYIDRYTPEQARRHEVRPGITGLAQVRGRNALNWERKFELDVEYVNRCSFELDATILALTVWQVIARHGVNQPGHATAQEFIGTVKRDASEI